MKKKQLIVIVAVAALIAAFFVFDLDRYFNLEYVKSQQAAIDGFFRANQLPTAAIYFLLYVIVTALSLPGATVMTLAGGAIFGLLWATVIVSFASTLGATLAFLVSRYVLRDAVQNRFADKLAAINAGVERDGAFYLFTLRLVPLFSFFAINLAIGLTPIKTWTFYWVSQLGMFAGTIVYVNAGTQLAQIDSLRGILSPTLLGSFVLLGVFPLIAKKIVDAIKARRVYRRWPKPRHFENNLVVIGAGAAGLVAAYIAAAVKAKVTLIEGHKMGGDCLNFGCVPSKALLRTVKLIHQTRHAGKYGVERATVEYDFAAVMERVQRVIKTVEPHDSVERYTKLGVDVIQGHAKITSPWTVEVNGRTLTTRAIVIAAGARPFIPPIAGLKATGY